MTKQDPRFCEHVSDERLRELYGQCVGNVDEYERWTAAGVFRTRPEGPKFVRSVLALEFGQILNELISTRAALAMLAAEKDEKRGPNR